MLLWIEMSQLNVSFLLYRVSQNTAPTLQCHINKNIEFDVLKFSTVIEHELKWYTEKFYVITSTHSKYAGVWKLENFQPCNYTKKYEQNSFKHYNMQKDSLKGLF